MTSTNKRFRLKFLFQQIDLTAEKFVIGRSPSCNLTLEDALVSRTHAIIKTSGDSCYIEDLNSRNGTSVNGAALCGKINLKADDRIRIGSHELLFIVETGKTTQRDGRSTGALIKCAACQAHIAFGTSHCPHCDTAIPQKRTCPGCNQSIPEHVAKCTWCGASFEQTNADDSAQPIDSKWTVSLALSFVKQALHKKMYEQADKSLQSTLERNGAIQNTSQLIEVTEYMLILADQLNEPEKLEWILDTWKLQSIPLPEHYVEQADKLCKRTVFSHLATKLKEKKNTDSTRIISRIPPPVDRNQ